jgi:hypothetical protein
MADDPNPRSRIEDMDLEDEPLIILARRIREVLLKDGSIERALADGHITTMQLMKLLNAISGARRAVGFVHPSSLDDDHEQGRITKQDGIFIPSKLQ